MGRERSLLMVRDKARHGFPLHSWGNGITARGGVRWRGWSYMSFFSQPEVWTSGAERKGIQRQRPHLRQKLFWAKHKNKWQSTCRSENSKWLHCCVITDWSQDGNPYTAKNAFPKGFLLGMYFEKHNTVSTSLCSFLFSAFSSSSTFSAFSAAVLYLSTCPSRRLIWKYENTVLRGWH